MEVVVLTPLNIEAAEKKSLLEIGCEDTANGDEAAEKKSLLEIGCGDTAIGTKQFPENKLKTNWLWGHSQRG